MALTASQFLQQNSVQDNETDNTSSVNQQASTTLDPYSFLGLQPNINQASQPISTTLDPYSFLGLQSITPQPTEQQEIDTTSYYPDGYENSWGNRFAIATDKMQESLYKGVDLIADITGAENLKNYAQEGIQRNIKQAAEKPQPTRTASFTEGGAEVIDEIKEGDILGAINRGLLLFKDMSAEVLPSMAPVLGGALVAAPVAAFAAPLGTAGLATATALRVLGPFIPGYLMGSGETYDEAKRLGVSEKDAQGWAVAGGVGIGLLDRIGAMGILKGAIDSFGEKAVVNEFKKALPKVSEKTIKKKLKEATDKKALKDIVSKQFLLEAGKRGKDAVKNVTKQGFKAGGIEAGTEAAQETLQMIAAQGGAVTGKSEITPYEFTDYVKRATDAAALGFTGGKLTGIGASFVQKAQQRDVDIKAEKENEAVENLKKNLHKNPEELASIVEGKIKETRPSLAEVVLRTAISPLFDLSTKSSAGYNVYSAFKNYYDNVSSGVGAYANNVEKAFNLVRKDIKTPFARSISKLNNDELYSVLAYGKKTKDKKIKEAAEIIRRDILGEKLGDEVSLNKNNLMKQIKEGRSTLEESEKALGQTENLTPSEVTRLNEKVNKVNSAFDTLKNFYNTKVEEIRKTYTTGAARLNPKDKYIIVGTTKKGKKIIYEEDNVQADRPSAKGKSSYKTPQEAFAQLKTQLDFAKTMGQTLNVYRYQGNAKNAKFTNKNKITEESLTGKLDSKKFNEALSKLDRYFFERGKRGAVFTSQNKKIKDAFKEVSNDKAKKGLGFNRKTGEGTLIQPVKASALFGQLINSNVNFDFRTDYFPRLYKFNTPFAWNRARKILMSQDVVDSKTKKKRKRTEEEANEIIDNIRGNDNIQSQKVEGLELERKTKEDRLNPEQQADFENARRIDEETFKLLDEAGLVERNVKRIIDRYILQAIQREQVGKLKSVLDANIPFLTGKRKDETGETRNLLEEWEAKRITDLYDAIQNRYKPIKREGINKLVRFMNTYQYMLTLPLAALTALSEPFIVLSRVGPQHAIYGISRATANAFRQGIRSVLPKLEKTRSEMEFRQILQGFDGTLAERLGDIAGISVSRRITDAFFKATLLTQVTQFSRDIAAQAITSQMRRDIKLLARRELDKTTTKTSPPTKKEAPTLFKLTKEEADAKRRLRELGLIDVNLKSGKKDLVSSDVFKWATGELEGTAPDIIRKALSRGVDDIIMAPNAINRPLWMSDPHLALVAQLKGFMFAFGSKVGMRLYREVFKPLSQGRIPIGESVKYAVSLSLIIAVSLAVKELKDELRYGDEPSPFKKKTGWQHFRDALLTSNIFGPGTPIYEMLRANQYGSSPFGIALGPSFQWAESIVRALGDAVRGNPRQAIRQGVRAIPGVGALQPGLASEMADKLGY